MHCLDLPLGAFLFQALAEQEAQQAVGAGRRPSGFAFLSQCGDQQRGLGFGCQQQPGGDRRCQ